MKPEIELSEIAVVIVTRNMRAPLRRTLESLAELADDRIRIYVVDGASNDGTVDDLRRSSAANLAWQSEPDGGIYDAMNKGWKMPPSHAYMLYLGAGDKIVSLPKPETLARTHRERIDILIGTCTIGSMVFRSGWTADLHTGNTAHHQALMIRKSLHPEPPFDVSFRVYGDWDFNVKLFRRGCRAFFDNDFRSYAEPGGASASHHLSEVWRVSKRHGGTPTAIYAYFRNLREKVKAGLRNASRSSQ